MHHHPLSSLKALFFLPFTFAIPYQPAKIVGNHNCHGSGACGLLMEASGQCTRASWNYQANRTYTQYTSNVNWGSIIDDPTGGCAAIFKCYSPQGYQKGASYEDIMNAFGAIYQNDGCSACGSHQLPNPDCWVTYNYCLNCKKSAYQGDPIPSPVSQSASASTASLAAPDMSLLASNISFTALAPVPTVTANGTHFPTSKALDLTALNLTATNPTATGLTTTNLTEAAAQVQEAIAKITFVS